MLKSIRIFLSIAASLDLEIWQMDVKTAFLNGSLDESIYMMQPEGFIEKGQMEKVCKLQKSIYGLKQASRSWNIRFDQAVKGVLTSVKEWLAKQFDMKDLGEASFILGIQVIRDRKNRTIALSQASYIDKILSRFSMQDSKKGMLPFRHGIKLSKEQVPKNEHEEQFMSRVPYASAVGSLMYAMLCIRLDICFAIGIVSRILISNQILTPENPHQGLCLLLEEESVIWRSIKQSCIADSTMEAEYVAACEAAKEAVWLRQFLIDLEVGS
ncbi:hypothetical protein LWI29_030815 [Acer saccharum]|uniref:Reverse transcriptase Ty1/copia-type domain-containing protein n=1 Tax=Acer saccharum TaxID=4024 RepID=A0AA39SFL3_ACESA|nr:hypothetical protein LWI29_030815 [Acer saccharum]